MQIVATVVGPGGIAFVIALLTQLLLPLIHHTPLLTG